jgi:hypothetical protein
VAKKTRRSKKRQHTIKPLVKQIDAHIKRLKKAKAKKGTTPQQKKQLDKHIKHMSRVKVLAMDGCDAFILAMN